MGRHARRSNHVLMKVCELQSLETNVKHGCKWYQHIAMKRRFYWSTKRNASWVYCEGANQDSIPQSLFSHLPGDMWEGPTTCFGWLATSYNKMVSTLKKENGWAEWATVRNVYGSLGCVLVLRFVFRRTHDNAESSYFLNHHLTLSQTKISALIMIFALHGLVMNNLKVLSWRYQDQLGATHMTCPNLILSTGNVAPKRWSHANRGKCVNGNKSYASFKILGSFVIVVTL